MVTVNNSIDTIVAQATPPGRGGVAIVRVSGPEVLNIIRSMLGCELKPRQATYLSFCDVDQAILDEGIAVFFPNPNSFTGEDVLELHGHGGPVVVDLVLQRIINLGARLARPGEFSERAFLNNKIDLTQAEAIADLIEASSVQAARLALRSLQGEFSKAIHALNEKVTHLRMYIEAAIDFTDEEIDFLSDEKISLALQDTVVSLTTIQENAQQGSLMREGITAVIAGEPNVGKSSLLNYLSGKDSAIVTNVPGTTRDVLREHILIDDIPLHIVDTAGLRHSDDVVENEGIRRAHQEIEKADMVLYVMSCEAKEHPSYWSPHVFSGDQYDKESFAINCPIIFIRNKIDLLNETPSITQEENRTVISLSAKTGAGVELLKKHIKSQIGFTNAEEGIFLARRRHLDALSRAHVYLQKAAEQLKLRCGELAAEDLRLAQQALGEITGEFTADDLLGKIFSSFCIGK